MTQYSDFDDLAMANNETVRSSSLSSIGKTKKILRIEHGTANNLRYVPLYKHKPMNQPLQEDMDESYKMERAIYRNPLETIATLLMIDDKGFASLENIEEICEEKTLVVLYDCIRNDIIQEKNGNLLLTGIGIKYVNEWEKTLD